MFYDKSNNDWRFYINLHFTTKQMYRIIRNLDSVCGIRFTGVMILDDWYINKDLHDAYDSLKIRQPELFTSRLR